MRRPREATGTERQAAHSARRHHQLVALLLGVVALVAGCAASGHEQDVEATAISVSPEAFEPLLDAVDVTVVNVHVPYEGELPATDLFVPYDGIGDAAGLPDDPDVAIAIYCLTGRMSRQAAATLHDLGYQRVFELDGGMVAWRESGRPLVDRRSAPSGR